MIPGELAYLVEMQWLKNHGIINNYDDYENLDDRILEDCRMLMDAENKKAGMPF